MMTRDKLQLCPNARSSLCAQLEEAVNDIICAATVQFMLAWLMAVYAVYNSLARRLVLRQVHCCVSRAPIAICASFNIGCDMS